MRSRVEFREERLAIDDKDRNRWDWHVSLKASGPPRPAGQVSRCQLMSPLPGTMGFSNVMWNGPQRGPAEKQKEKVLRLLRFCRVIPDDSRFGLLTKASSSCSFFLRPEFC